MSRKIQCVKLKREEEGLERAPYPGELGQRIYENVSKAAWQDWLRHQTMLINEYRLVLMEPRARSFLAGEMEKYFFSEGDDVAQPEGYVPPNS
ncbi:MAG: oxidative damage protection protein [Gammaproteobacteria bacterium]|nr:oxidative damage protection protein [Gammaproteobacteria bacterium]